MSDSELDEILRSAAVPAREAAYWEEFPLSVMRRLATDPRREPGRLRWNLVRRPAWGVGLVAASILVLLASPLGRRSDSIRSHRDLATMRTCYEEIASLFPNQVRCVVRDGTGLRLDLSPAADIPDSAPVYVKVCGPVGCAQFVTFSGQQIQVEGQLWDVLTDVRGHILLASPARVWTSARPDEGRGGLPD